MGELLFESELRDGHRDTASMPWGRKPGGSEHQGLTLLDLRDVHPGELSVHRATEMLRTTEISKATGMHRAMRYPKPQGRANPSRISVPPSCAEVRF